MVDPQFEGVAPGPAEMGSGRTLFAGNSGQWAGMRFLEAIKAGREISAADLRTLDVLFKDEWKIVDDALIEEAAIRLRGVGDLLAAGLSKPITNALASTVYEYNKITDMDPAIVSLDGVTRAENDRIEFTTAGLPLPITHKDWYLNLRTLLASRKRGEALDVTYPRLAGRKIAEETERMLFKGGKTFAQLTIYGLTNHPNRNTASFGLNGNWAAAAKTGTDIVADVNTMKGLLEGDRFYGPFWIYSSSDASLHLGDDFKTNSDKTIRQRVLEIDGIERMGISDQMPANTVVMFQATPDVIQMLDGETLQTVQWDVHGGFQINFKAWQILLPLIRSDSQGRSGVVHMS